MPIYDMRCNKCNIVYEDVLAKVDEDVKCEKCGEVLERLMSTFSFSMVPLAVTRHRRKYGKGIPPDYKFSGGARVFK